MGLQVLGRTNRSFPPVWLSLSLPGTADSAERLVAAALDTGLPLDISSQPALWGGHMRGTNAILIAIGGSGISQAPDAEKAFSSIHAHLVELMSAVGRDWIDIYFLRISGALQEHQIGGTLEALADALEDGVVRHVGIYAEGPPQAARLIWQFNDAFDLALLPPSNFETLVDLANERRAGVVMAYPSAEQLAQYRPQTYLTRVRSGSEVEATASILAERLST